MTKKTLIILVVIGMGYLAGASTFGLANNAQAREKQVFEFSQKDSDRKKTQNFSTQGDGDDDTTASTSAAAVTPTVSPTPKVSPTPSPSPVSSPSPTPSLSPTPSQTPSPTPTPSLSPSPTPEPTPSPTPSPAPGDKNPASQLAMGIIDFFKSDPKPPSADTASSPRRGFNVLSSDVHASPYLENGDMGPSAKKAWYGTILALAFLGASTFMYGRSKHIA